MNKREYEILETKENILADNDISAAHVREELQKHKVFMVNLMASPGAGKTTLLVRTIKALKDKYHIGVMEADVDSDVDTAAVVEAGAKAIQLHTGGSCHMDADMTMRGMKALGLDDLDVLFLENVGNLVCPAEFDVGATKKVTDLLLIGKIDVLPVFDFDIERCKHNVSQLNDHIDVLPLSQKTGEGFEPWIAWLEKQIERVKGEKNENH